MNIVPSLFSLYVYLFFLHFLKPNFFLSVFVWDNQTVFFHKIIYIYIFIYIYPKLSAYNTPKSGCSSMHFLCINSLVFSLNLFQLLEYSN